jgi:hypothetical protein
VAVPAGTYELVDSKPATWSYTLDRGNKGNALVYGKTSAISDTPVTISKAYVQGDMVGSTAFYGQLSESVAKTAAALLQTILTVNSFLYTDFSSTTIETFRARKLEADKALDTLVRYAGGTESLIADNNPKHGPPTALSPEDVLATVASGPANTQIKTLMNTYGVNAKKAQLILNTAMAGLESSAWTDLAAVENQTLQTATLVKNGAALTLTIAGTVATAGAVTGALGAADAACAIVSGVDGVIKVTQSGIELAVGKEITLPDGSKAKMLMTTVSAVSDLIAFKDLPKLLTKGMYTEDNVSNVYTITSKIVDGFADKTITFGPAQVDIKSGLSIGSSIDLGYITSVLGGLTNAPSTLPGTYKINGVTTVVSTMPETMSGATNVLPDADKVDPVKIAGSKPSGTLDAGLVVVVEPKNDASAPDVARDASNVALSITSVGLLLDSHYCGTEPEAFSQQVMAAGGQPPYEYSVVAGSICPGLTLAGSTGLIAGTLSGSNNCSFSIQVKDSLEKTATADFDWSLDHPCMDMSVVCEFYCYY